MSPEQERRILKEISQVAALAGIPGHVDEEVGQFRLVCRWQNDRSQEVRVFPSGETEGGVVVSFESWCQVISKRELSKFMRRQAYPLLRLNADTLQFARFGVRETGQKNPAALVVVSVDHLLATLDPEEFQATAGHVAAAADRLEAMHGQDVF